MLAYKDLLALGALRDKDIVAILMHERRGVCREIRVPADACHIPQPASHLNLAQGPKSASRRRLKPPETPTQASQPNQPKPPKHPNPSLPTQPKPPKLAQGPKSRAEGLG